MNNRIGEITEQLRLSCFQIKETVKEAKKNGRKVIGCAPIFVPEELVYASGALPIGVWGSEKTYQKGSGKYYPPFACSVVQSITEQSMNHMFCDLDAVMVSTLCDTLKCLTQTLPLSSGGLRVIPVKYPQNYLIEGGYTYFLHELEGIKDQIEAVTGNNITEEALGEAIELYEKTREELRRFSGLVALNPDAILSEERHLVIKSRLYMDCKDYLPLLKELNDLLETSSAASESKKIRIYVAGTLAEPLGLWKLMDELNIAVVGDELAQETRQFRTKMPEASTQMQRLAKKLQCMRGEAFLYDPEKERCEVIAREAIERRAQGVLYLQMKFCDTDEYDYPWVRDAVKAKGLPILNIEIEQNMVSFEGVHTRLQAFAEQIGDS